MNTKLKWIGLAAVAIIAAGGFYARSLRVVPAHIPGDLRDAVAGEAFDTLNEGRDVQDINVPEPNREAAEAVKVVGSKSCWFGGRTASDGGPLFDGMAKRSAANKSSGIRFGDEAPYDVLKRMFEAGTQPGKKDLLGVAEGRLFVNNNVYKAVFVGRERALIPDSGPLFDGKKKLVAASFNTDLEPSSLCNSSEVEQLLDPVEYEDGSAATKWQENGYDNVTKFRMNSGYLIVQMPYKSEVRGYAYYFTKVPCRK